MESPMSKEFAPSPGLLSALAVAVGVYSVVEERDIRQVDFDIVSGARA